MHLPRTLWLSVALAAVALAGAVWRWRGGGRKPDDASVLAPPWRWPVYRFVGLTVLNTAIAAGIAIGSRWEIPLS